MGNFVDCVIFFSERKSSKTVLPEIHVLLRQLNFLLMREDPIILHDWKEEERDPLDVEEMEDNEVLKEIMEWPTGGILSYYFADRFTTTLDIRQDGDGHLNFVIISVEESALRKRDNEKFFLSQLEKLHYELNASKTICGYDLVGNGVLEGDTNGIERLLVDKEVYLSL